MDGMQRVVLEVVWVCDRSSRRDRTHAENRFGLSCWEDCGQNWQVIKIATIGDGQSTLAPR